MAYSKNKKDQVEETIKEYTDNQLEVYSQKDLLDIAKTKMEANATPQQVADAVYDLANENYVGDVVVATALNTCMTKDSLRLMRDQIIADLK